MSSPFLGVYTAIYDYQGQNDEELSLTENDILYLLEKSDFDDWWKVKKRVLDANLEEPQGLVPSTYIKPAEITSTAIALFDYTKQTEEELSFNEGSSLNVYDTSDPNWTLVNINNQQFGFVPANYIQINSNNNLNSINPTPFPIPNSVNSPTSTIPTPTPTPGLQYFPPPPQRSNRLSPSNQIDNAINNISDDENNHNNNGESELPPMPSRPTTTTSVSKSNAQHNNGSRSRFDNYSEDYSDDNYDDNDNQNNQSDKQKNESKSFFSPSRAKSNSRSRSNTANSKISRKKSISNFLLGSSNDNNNGNGNANDTIDPVNGDFAWKIHEIDGKKKRKGRLEIGDGKIYLDIDNKLSEVWPISNLTNYNSEKKHVFLDFKNPSYSFELHVGNKESAQAIISILGDIKGMTSLTALEDVKNATRDGRLEASKKKGTILFDFNAVADDELNCNEGDFVYIVNDKKSKDWWMVENKKGERGVVPSNFIKVVGDKEFDDKNGKRSKDSGFMKSLFGTSGNKSPKKKSSRDRDREERELREMAKLQREKDELEKQKRRQDRKEKELMMMDREQRDRLRRADDRLREKRMKKEMDKSSSTSKESSRPNTHRVRTWIDRSGTFKVEAEFIGIQEGKIHLHKLNGVKIAVAAQKLSSEDLEYVEKLTGMSLENYKQKSKSKSRDSEQQQQQQQVQSQPSLPSRENSSAIQRKKAIPYNTELIDYWFNFFVESNVDVNVCERYATNFASEQMDKSILEEITPALMRTLGIKEGDILKVKKHLDIMFNRYVSPEPVTNPSSATATLPSSESFSKPSSSSNDDEAWTVKPASKTTGDKLVPQITGSIKDLLDVKPMQATKTGITPVKPINTIPATTTGSLPLLQQKTSSLPSQQTGAPLMAMPTGFMPITMVPMMTGIPGQPTGFMPMRTGGLTGGLSMPLTSFNQQPQQKTGGYMLPLNTGINNMPMTSFGMGAQPTGGLVKLQPTGVILNKTGGADLIPTMQPTMKTGGGFMPQTSFGMQLTGAVNGFNNMPTNSFGNQAPLNNALTGGIPPAMTGGFPMTSFGTGIPQMTGGMQNFGSVVPVNNAYTGGLPPAITGGLPPSMTGGLPPAMTGNMGGMPMTSFGAPISQMNGGLPVTSFGNGMPAAMTGGMNGMSAAMTGGMGGMPATSFGGNNQMNQMTNMFNQASLNPQPQFQQQQQQMQMQQQQQPTLQPQPTGLGFGNGPIVSGIPGGKQANLANASADNPFGF